MLGSTVLKWATSKVKPASGNERKYWRARAHVRTEERLVPRVESQLATGFVAAGERLPCPADRVEAARRMDEVERLSLHPDAGERSDRVLAGAGEEVGAV